MRSALAIGAAALIAMMLQTAIFPRLVPGGMLVPNFVLVLVVYVGLRHHGLAGLAGAFALGYFLDSFTGTMIGVHAFGFTIVYAAVVFVSGALWAETGAPAVLLVLGAGGLHTLTALVVTAAVGASAPLWRHAIGLGLVEMALVGICAPWIFRFLAWEEQVLGVD